MSQDKTATSPPSTEVDQSGPVTRFPDSMPPTRTIERMDAPPLSSNPTSAQLKADIDSGATGDKIGVFDPGLSPLGTDDEAAGTSPSPERIRLARHNERTARWAGRKLRGTSHTSRDPVLIGYVGAIVFIGLVLVIGIALVR
jgi:hypothetical protein